MLTETSFVAIFFFCEIGEMVSSQFIVFDEKLYQCDWHSFPIEMQRMFVLMLSSTQQIPIIQGFGNTKCTRDAFKTVKLEWNKNPGEIIHFNFFLFLSFRQSSVEFPILWPFVGWMLRFFYPKIIPKRLIHSNRSAQSKF